MFKVGDYVQVVIGNYSITAVGSWGIVDGPDSGLFTAPSVDVKFYHLASRPIDPSRANLFSIQENDLAPFTPPPALTGVPASIPIPVVYPPAPTVAAPPLPPIQICPGSMTVHPVFRDLYFGSDFIPINSHDCMTNLKSYEGLTDTFRYCTICDHKVRD